MAQRVGLALGEVVVVLVIALVAVGMLILMIPRQRSDARGTVCRSRLSRLGVAVALYDQKRGELPKLPGLEGPEESLVDAGPVYQLLSELGQYDFEGFLDVESPPTPSPGAPGDPGRITGLLCPDDPRSRETVFPAPVSYRATTGDREAGVNGPFAPGRAVSMEEVEAADGLAFTAFFSERLLGAGEDLPGVFVENYAVVAELEPEAAPASLATWRGDAGSNWARAGWISTLYNHAVAPGIGNSQVSEDGERALMGASSGHLEGVHVLKGDLSVSMVTRAVDLAIWKALGRFDDVSVQGKEATESP